MTFGNQVKSNNDKRFKNFNFIVLVLVLVLVLVIIVEFKTLIFDDSRSKLHLISHIHRTLPGYDDHQLILTMYVRTVFRYK